MSCSACWETGTDLAQFGQFGQLGKRRKADADHAEELQLRVLVCQTLHLAGLTVLQHQLHHLEVKCNADERRGGIVRQVHHGHADMRCRGDLETSDNTLSSADDTRYWLRENQMRFSQNFYKN